MAGHATTTEGRSQAPKAYKSFTLYSPAYQWQPEDLRHFPAPLRFRARRTVDRSPISYRTFHRNRMSRRALRLCVALIACVLLAGQAADLAAAKTKKTKPCADQVIGDWYDDGRVNKIYPLACYRQAIAKLPPDIVDYSNAKEEIGRALAFAKQGKPDPGGADPTPAPTGTGKTGTGKTGTGKTGTGKTGTGKTGTGTTGTGTIDTAPPAADTSGPSSVPIPLLVLG